MFTIPIADINREKCKDCTRNIADGCSVDIAEWKKNISIDEQSIYCGSFEPEPKMEVAKVKRNISKIMEEIGYKGL